MIDVPPAAEFKLVALKHAVAANLAQRLGALVAGRQPTVRVLAQDSANALLISGPSTAVLP